MDPKKYIPRIVDGIIDRKMKTSGAVHITGPKGCGKSTTASMFCKTDIRLQDPNQKNYLLLAENSPSDLLSMERPVLIDEWQMVPSLWDSVRSEVDNSDDMGIILLTGSSVPKDNGYSHSGVGRITEVRMRTMSLFESGDSDGSVSLKKLFDGDKGFKGRSELSKKDIASLIVRGGWPRSVRIDREYAPDVVENYYNSTIGIDVFRVDGKKKNPETVDRLLKSYARNISTLATMKTIIQDVKTYEALVSQSTIEDYVDALKRLFIIEDVPPWSPSIRSRTNLRASPKRMLADPSIAAMALNMGEEKMLGDPETFGFLFEALCIRDLRVYSSAIKGKVSHYHDATDLEVDAIVQLRDGRWGAVEIKSSPGEIPGAESNLLKLKELVEAKEVDGPAFMMVLLPTGPMYETEEGVWVVPIGCLGP